MTGAITELPLLVAGAACYLASTIVALHEAGSRRAHAGLVLTLLGGGVVFFALAIAERWLRLGHGPFLSLFEILLSNLFSLGAIYTVAYWRLPVVRSGAAAALPVLLVLCAWILAVPRDAVHPGPEAAVRSKSGRTHQGAFEDFLKCILCVDFRESA